MASGPPSVRVGNHWHPAAWDIETVLPLHEPAAPVVVYHDLFGVSGNQSKVRARGDAVADGRLRYRASWVQWPRRRIRTVT